ncbi:hypothetical protein AB8P51_15000 [Muriicola sp. SD30]|uniref:hypothetical protein n=1 Tax=Muriicola sp. SD30 TaxID=3240936 RepID=UPI00350F9E5C
MNRPKIAIKKSKFDKSIEILSFLMLVGSVAIILIYSSQLPEKLPIYFNTPLKDSDGFGNKSLLWELPIILGIIVFIIYKLSQYPWIFNYPIKIKPENAEYNYKLSSQMLRVLGFAISFTCFSLTLTSILNGLGYYEELASYLSPFIIGLLFGIPIVYMILILIKKNYVQQRL